MLARSSLAILIGGTYKNPQNSASQEVVLFPEILYENEFSTVFPEIKKGLFSEAMRAFVEHSYQKPNLKRLVEDAEMLANVLNK